MESSLGSSRTNLSEEVAKIRRAALYALAVCVVTLATGFYLLPEIFEFPTDLPSKLAFVFQVNLSFIFWVVLASGMVSHGRRQRVEDIWGSAFGPPSAALSIKVAFLQNTLEQAAMVIPVHAALATLISGANLSFIPGSAFLFSVGRIAFYRGYSKGAGGRAFGMVTTALPTLFGFVAACVLSALKLF